MVTVTLDFSTEHATRIQDALTIALELGTPATVDDYKDYLINKTKQFVGNIERQEIINAVSLPTEIEIT